MIDKLEERVQDVFRQVFRMDVIPLDASPITIEGWDSLAHLNLMLELETSLGISINTQEYAEMISYSSIIDILSNKYITNI